MIIKGIISEDFINYKKTSMTIEFPYCNFKCDKECGKPVCQNSKLVNLENIEVPVETLISFYLKNDLTQAIVLQGLEPMDSKEDVYQLINYLRRYSDDDIVIYTGYTEEELKSEIQLMQDKYNNIIIKFGRFIPDQPSHFDEVLGIKLASPNQYAKKIC